MDYAPDDLERCACNADVRHTFDADIYVMNGGMTRSAPIRKRTVKFECTACGRELRREKKE